MIVRVGEDVNGWLGGGKRVSKVGKIVCEGVETSENIGLLCACLPRELQSVKLCML